jgi:hypothetical protein
MGLIECGGAQNDRGRQYYRKQAGIIFTFIRNSVLT